MTDLTLLELFAGIGGFSCGFERAGVRTVAAVEIDQKSRSVFSGHFPQSALFDDVREVSGDDIRATGFVPERGVLTAGWPCQDISSAGFGRGLAGERSGLFTEVVRLLEELRPRWFLLENVARLLSINGGRDMGTVIGALAECGYGIAYRVLDASGFGVPQRRRRVFFVGHLGGTGRTSAEVLFDTEELRVCSSSASQEKSERSKIIRNGAANRRWRDSITRADPVGTLTAGGVGTCGADDNQAQVGHLIEEFDGVRRLTPVECERLQGFDAGWTYGQSDRIRYRMIGNSVAVPVIEWIAKRLVEVDERVESGHRRENNS